MNNLYRELAPISDAAWADIEQEARRTFEQHVAARRVVDLSGPDGSKLATVNTGHLTGIEALGFSHTLLRLEAELAWHEECLKALPAIFAGSSEPENPAP